MCVFDVCVAHSVYQLQSLTAWVRAHTYRRPCVRVYAKKLPSWDLSSLKCGECVLVCTVEVVRVSDGRGKALSRLRTHTVANAWITSSRTNPTNEKVSSTNFQAKTFIFYCIAPIDEGHGDLWLIFLTAFQIRCNKIQRTTHESIDMKMEQLRHTLQWSVADYMITFCKC